MRKLLTALLMATMAMPAMAQTNPLVEDAKLSVADMIQVTSRPIAILERVDNDPGEFWYKAMQALYRLPNGAGIWKQGRENHVTAPAR